MSTEEPSPVTVQQRAGHRPPRTNTYDTLDGTSVAAELVDSVQCLADVLHIAQIRASQRTARAA